MVWEPDYLLPVWSVVGALEAQETLLPLRALLPGGLVRRGAGVEAGVEDDSHGAGLLVGSTCPGKLIITQKLAHCH